MLDLLNKFEFEVEKLFMLYLVLLGCALVAVRHLSYIGLFLIFSLQR